MATATSAQIRERLAPVQTQRQRLDERVPKLESEVRELRERLIEASVAAATAATQNGEEKHVAEIERKLAKAERDLDTVQRERATATATITTIEREYARVRQNEITIDAVREARTDFGTLVRACTAIADVIRRDEERRHEVERGGMSADQIFGVRAYPKDLVALLRHVMETAAEHPNVDRGAITFTGDPLITWRAEEAQR